jgi:predicted transcriptional regulator
MTRQEQVILYALDGKGELSGREIVRKAESYVSRKKVHRVMSRLIRKGWVKPRLVRDTLPYIKNADLRYYITDHGIWQLRMSEKAVPEFAKVFTHGDWVYERLSG